MGEYAGYLLGGARLASPATYQTDGFDLTYFVVYQLRIIERAMEHFIDHYQAMQQEAREIERWLDRLGLGCELNYRQAHLLKSAIRLPGTVFTAKEVTHAYDVSENTARKDLEKLADMKVFAKVKEGKAIFMSPVVTQNCSFIWAKRPVKS